MPVHVLKGCSITERLVKKDPTNNGLQRDLGVSLDHVGGIYASQGKGEKALEHYQRALEILRLLAKKEPEVVDRHVALASALLDMFRVTEDEDKKREFIQEAKSITKSLVDAGVSHPQLKELRKIFSL